MSSLQLTTPGYTADSNFGFVQAYIRGVGNAIFVGADPSVATFVDDVPQIYGAMIDSLADVERVEILKGAQGGLYGRNATGGVINIITRQPSTEAFKGELLASYGEKDTRRLGGYVNVPLGDHLAWSLSAERDTHDPYVDNLAPAAPYSAANFPDGSFVGTAQQTADFFNAAQQPSQAFTQDFWAAHSKLLFRPRDDFSFTLAGSYAKKDDNSSGQFFNATPEFGQSVLVGFFNSLGINAQLPPGFLQGPSGKWTTRFGTESYIRMRDYGVSGTAIWAAPNFDLTSITAYRNLKTSTLGDTATLMVPTIPVDVKFDRDYVYQEFRATSSFEGPWRLLGGVTYLDNKLQGQTDLYLLSYSIPLASTAVDQQVTNWSVYGEAAYAFTDHLELSVSGRYMREKNQADFTQPVVSGSDSEQKKFAPSATLSYDLDHGNVYLRWAQGFKTGGVNILTAPVNYPKPSDGSVFGPETVDTYEAGFKSSLFGRSVQVTAAVFYNDYRDLQVDVRPRPEYPAITTAIVNADSAETYGAEGSLNWRVAAPVILGINVGYLHAEYKDFSLSGSEVLSDFDRSGQRMPRSPAWQYSLNANLDQPVGHGLRLVSNVLAAYTSEMLFKYGAYPGVLPDPTAESYWLVNARIGLKTEDERYAFSVIADNLFDQEYYIGADAGTFGNLLNYGTRRIVRAEFRVRF